MLEIAFLIRIKSLKGILQPSVLRDMRKGFLFIRENLRHSGTFLNMDLKIMKTLYASCLKFGLGAILQFHLWTFDYTGHHKQ